VRRDVERCASSEGGSEHSAVARRVGERLIEEIRPLVGQHGVRTETLAGALEEALLEVGGKEKEVSAEELRYCLLGLVLWKIFGGGATLWISSKTEGGHEVPLDVLVTAYAIWGKAVRVADKYGVDTAAAAEALAAATHVTADKLAGNGEVWEGKEIR